ncbi:uncharacterized protein BJ171DRAFT_506336 [Polychytrium aggregatum]|uniref:uncharacterized protein n=1 Tax=Polychytrium aggregatum TaxID=110093 RepID=UPI0022FEC76F|nr:uncharacterized protein BJ171DRAFT_506336 [Polychytrium aggregatum]KAI9204170.1 hypothetical protein BJ171DRAFT_506336 [Polychytrium aggregatum]
MTIRPVPLQKREHSARARSNYDSFGPYHLDNFQVSRPTSARPTSGRQPSTRATSARPTSAKNAELLHNTQANMRIPSALINKTGNSYSWKRNNPGMRLLPLNSSVASAQAPASLPLNDVIFGTSIGQLKAAGGPPQPPVGWDTSSRPSTSYSTAAAPSGKRLPPIRGGIATPSVASHDAITEALGGSSPALMYGGGVPMGQAKSTRHVLFDAPETIEIVNRTRAGSPRPFSARRQPSANFRNRLTSTSRPHTAFEREDSKTAAIASKSKSRITSGTHTASEDRAISPITGTRMAHSGSRPPIISRRKARDG